MTRRDFITLLGGPTAMWLELQQDLGLETVGVLEFIDKDMIKSVPKLRSEVGIVHHF